jgi:hypothetical protein
LACDWEVELVATKAEWLALGEKILLQYDLILSTAEIPQKSQDDANQCTVAMALLCRTANNYAGARELLEKDFVVEARTLVRSCYENLFWIAGLQAQGRTFIDKMILSDATNRIKRGRALLEWARQNGGRPFENTLADFISQLDSETPVKGDVNFADLATAGNIKGAYIIYRVLSTDAAHPSAVSLDRHLRYDDRVNPTSQTFLGMPRVDVDEEAETAHFAVTSLLMVALLADKILGGTKAGDALSDIYEEFKKLSGPKA